MRTILITIVLGALGTLSATAETLRMPYDPVARAIALGLTPEAVDAAFDRGLSSAESCDTAARTLRTMACDQRDIATTDTPTLPRLES